MKLLRILALILAITALIPLSACKETEAEPRTKTFYEYFDTVSHIFSHADEDNEDFEANTVLIGETLEKYHRLCDIYYEYSGMNNLKTVNTNAGVAPVAVAPELIELLIYAKDIYRLTGGKANILIGAVTSLWHDCREAALGDPNNASLPANEALYEAAKHTDIDCLIIDKDAGTVYLNDPKARIDVGAIAKGFATEKVSELLRNRGVQGYALNIGGNISVIGSKPSGKGWSTGITNPDKESASRYALHLSLADISCVTSGSYERYYTVEGKRYHHIIDPSTLYPSNYFASVSVLCKDSGLADALSTSLFCMSYEEGMSLISSIENVEALWIYEDGSMKMTEGVKKIIISDK